MTWAAYLVRTMTGQKGEQLDLASDPSWSIPLNGIEDLSVTVSRRQLREIDPGWRKPWAASVLLCWESPLLGRVPWVMGPISQPIIESRTSDSAQLVCKGLGALLEKRVVLDRDYGVGEMGALSKSIFSRKGLSLGSIAQDIVRTATEEKVGGYVPIRYASPREQGSTLNERNYPGYNLANNFAWKLLTELSEVRNGPDFAFRPEFVDETETHVRWAMHHGTYAQPTIAQTWMMDLDTTSSEGPVSDIAPKTSVTDLAQRAYWTGAGEGAGTLIRSAFDIDRLSDYTPLLEKVGSTSDSESASLIAEHAAAAIANGSEPLVQFSVDINGADEEAEIGRWRVGDAAYVKTAGWLDLEDGRRQRRIISAKGSGGPSVTLEFQEDVW